MPDIQPEFTIPYTTALLTGVVDGVRRTIAAHPDKGLSRTKVTLENPVTKADYPTVTVKYFERSIENAGIGHKVIDSKGAQTKRYIYKGDLEFGIYTLDSKTRDLMANTIVQMIAFGRMADWTANFFKRLLDTTQLEIPSKAANGVIINTDKIQPFGQTKVPTPWQNEAFIYQTAYRTECFGEMVNVPWSPAGLTLINKIILYPYTDQDPIPQGNLADTSPWLPQ